MVTVYFAGHNSFGNRGCEALIRCNVKALRVHVPDATFLVPSSNIERDTSQWPEGPAKQGVRFVPSEPIPLTLRWWSRVRRVFGAVSNVRPKLAISETTRQLIGGSDVLIMTGGDIISLDYGLESLYFWMSICEIAMDSQVKTMLWGASVGPFSKEPELERRMVEFLKRFDIITVRETPSLEYLRALGIAAELVTDPAFSLDPEPCVKTLGLQVLTGEGDLLGFNVSPVIEMFRDGREAKSRLLSEVVDFLDSVVRIGRNRVLLVPHVDPFEVAGRFNSDSIYMGRILRVLRERGLSEGQVDLLPSTLNAAELKYVIGRCDYFIGGRTHATIAALSAHVPTASIAYSVKAKGINYDLFGHLDYVLETPQVSQENLHYHFGLLQRRNVLVREHLKENVPRWRQRAAGSAARLSQLVSPIAVSS